MAESEQPTAIVEFSSVSGLSKWFFWLGTLCVTGVAVTAVCILAPAHIDLVMYVVIVGLALLTVAGSYKVASEVDRQAALAGKHVAILENVDSFEYFLAETENEPSLLRSHVESLYSMAWSHTQVSQDKLIQILQVRLRSRNRVNDLFASILTTLGLIGTIVGLVVMMGSLSEQIKTSSGDTAQLMAQLFDENTGALGGLGIAFITTLLGAVLGGILLRVLTSVVDASITQYVAVLAELTEVHVLPSVRVVAERRGRERRVEELAHLDSEEQRLERQRVQLLERKTALAVEQNADR